MSVGNVGYDLDCANHHSLDTTSKGFRLIDLHLLVVLNESGLGRLLGNRVRRASVKVSASTLQQPRTKFVRDEVRTFALDRLEQTRQRHQDKD